MIIEQRAQLLQTLGSVGTSAANSATEGIAEAVKTDSKTVETALKLFGGFDRSEFENINEAGTSNLLLPAVRPAASYEGPAEYFKSLSNAVEGQSLLVPAKDLLQQLQDPRFRIVNALFGFSNNRITQSLAQKGIIIHDKPGGNVSLDGLDENGIITIDNKPAEADDMVASLDSFGKLYRMENAIEKQLQLHEQLDFNALRFPASKQSPLPRADSPKPDQEPKDLHNVQLARPQFKEMNPQLDPGINGTPEEVQMSDVLTTALYHALIGTPETVGEMVQMLDVLIAKMKEISQEDKGVPIADSAHFTKCNAIIQQLNSLKHMCQNFPTNSEPNPALLAYLASIRQIMQHPGLLNAAF